MRQEQVLELVGATNPVHSGSKRPEQFPSPSALLALIDERSRDMQKIETVIRPQPRPEPPPGRPRRWLVPALAGAAVIIAAVVVTVMLLGGSNDERAPDVISPATTVPTETPESSGTVLPVVAADGSNVGEAYEVAFNAHDSELLASLFTVDADVRMAVGGVTSLDVLLASAEEVNPVLGTQVEMGECSASAGRVQCTSVRVTYDWLKPLLESPVNRQMTFTVEDGLITKLRSDTVFVEEPGETRPREAQQFSQAGVVMAEFKAWTFENYPEEADRMWIADQVTQPSFMETAEAAELAMTLGQEYVDSLQ